LAVAKRRQVSVTCAICGQVFELKPSRAGRLERHTCSPPCRRELLCREASREVSLRNLASGRAARWDKEKADVARRLSALDESAFAMLSERDPSMVSAYYGLGGRGTCTQGDLARQLGLTADQDRRRITRSKSLLLGEDKSTKMAS
jgi:hypothetical protein